MTYLCFAEVQHSDRALRDPFQMGSTRIMLSAQLPVGIADNFLYIDFRLFIGFPVGQVQKILDIPFRALYGRPGQAFNHESQRPGRIDNPDDDLFMNGRISDHTLLPNI